MFPLKKAFCLTILFFIPLFSHASPITLASVLEVTNQARKSTLVSNTTLQAVAQMRADDMASRDYFSHASPEGLRNVYKLYIDALGYKPKTDGENLAKGFSNVETMQTAFIASPLHRANILNPLYTEMGVGIAINSAGQVFVVEIFGRPLSL